MALLPPLLSHSLSLFSRLLFIYRSITPSLDLYVASLFKILSSIKDSLLALDSSILRFLI